MCPLVSWTDCGDGQRLKAEVRSQGWKKPRRSWRNSFPDTLKIPRWDVYTEQTPTITLGHEFAEHFEEFVQNLRRNLCGLILIQVYDSVGYRTMSLWSQIYQKLYQTMIYSTTWGKHWSFLLLGSRPKLLGKRWKQCKEAGPTIQCPSCGLYRCPLCSTLPTALETTSWPACLPNILLAKDCVLLITATSLPGTEETANHICETNQWMKSRVLPF